MKTADKFTAWHLTRVGRAVMGLLELVIAYLLASRAIDTGSWWEYLFTFIFLTGAIRNFVQLLHIFRKHHA